MNTRGGDDLQRSIDVSKGAISSSCFLYPVVSKARRHFIHKAANTITPTMINATNTETTMTQVLAPLGLVLLDGAFVVFVVGLSSSER